MDRSANIDTHTTAWSIQVWMSFLLSLGLTVGGVFLVPLDLWPKAYLLMGTLFTVGSSFTLSKTVRDNHEASKLRNRMMKAKSDKLLKDFELSEVA